MCISIGWRKKKANNQGIAIQINIELLRMDIILIYAQYSHI